MNARPVSHVAPLCAALLAVSCSDPLGPDVDQVDVSLSVSQPELVPRDTVAFRVVGTNSTQRTLSFQTHACAAFQFRLLASGGLPVFGHPRTCNDIGQLHVLAPGDSIVETILFDGTSSWGPFLDENGQEATFILAPGVYVAVATLEGSANSPADSIRLRIRPLP